MTLVEVLTAMGIGSVLLTAIASTWIFMARSFYATGNYADLDRASRNALDVLSRDVRQASGVSFYSPSKIRLSYVDGSSLTYAWHPISGTLTRDRGADAKVLLTGCDYLNFNVSQRNPSNDFTFYKPPASNFLAQIKLVDVTWRCSRQILGQKVNTESVQTAKIVIRN